MSRVLSVLMWKHGVVRIRKYIHTIVDLLSPLMFFAILFVLKDKYNPPRTFIRMDTSLQANTEELDLMHVGEIPRTILYSPDTPLTTALMDEVGGNLGISRLYTFPDNSSEGYFPYSKDVELVKFTSDMHPRDAVVIFHGVESADKWPTKLNYTIRMKHDFNTGGYESHDNSLPHRMFGVNYLTFMRLQWAIDSAYIKTQSLHSEDQMRQSISLQEFPYYKSMNNEGIRKICALINIMCWLSLLLTYVFLMVRLLEERTSGIQELVKMVGVSLNTLGLSHYLNVLPCGLVFSIVGTIFLKSSSNPILPNSNPFHIFLFLILYFNTIVALAFVCCYIIRSSEYAVTVAVISYGMLWFPAWMVAQYSVPYVIRIMAGLLPHTPMFWFWTELGTLEMYGSGVTFGNMFRSHDKKTASVFLSYVFMLIQTALFFFLAWYMSRVRPGKYGQALPWNFLFKQQYWLKNEVRPGLTGDSDSIELINQDEQYFEKPPDNLNVGIRIEDVSKVYPQHVALRDVTLNVYEGEITVLVGHNGAGKTTLMSIITGMTSATKGKVYVHELDTVTQQDEVRQRIGLCPQHNMFFPDLTLQQHIMFFTMLKKGTYSEARESSRKLAAQLGLENKLGEMCSALSGGMKRRAQLACALAGDADVLVLDEPTSGLDVETRRELWDLLLSLRGTRTVLLSTHFMEEADALGDRVAALHAGHLRCFATTMHLKRAVGDGYRLSLTTIGLPKEKVITKEVLKHVPDASIKEQTLNSISYTLPASANNKFPDLFSALESKRSELGIDSIGVGVSTLEEVFLKLCSDVDTTIMEEEAEHTAPEPTVNRLTGVRLYCRQLMVLLKRQIRFACYRKWIFLIMQVIIPVMLVFLITKQSNNELTKVRSGALKMDLDVYSDMPDRRVLYNLQVDEDVRFRAMDNEYPGVSFERAKDVADTVLRIGKADTLEYNKYLAGVELNETNAKFLFTTTVRHAAPVALNLLSNVLARRYLANPTAQIHTYNHPIEGYVREKQFKEPKRFDLIILWAVFITFFIQATVLHCVSLPCRERETGSRHIHIMSGCPAELHWAATLIFHMALTILFLILPTVVALLTIERDGTFDQMDFIMTFSAILAVGSMALLAFMYLTSFSFSERYANIILVACLFVFGLVLPLMKLGYDLLEEQSDEPDHDVTYYVLLLSWYISPMYTMVSTALQSVQVARINAWCQVLRSDCPAIFVNEFGWTDDVSTKCCANQMRKVQCYFCMEKTAPMEGIITLFVQFLVFMTMVMMTQRGIFNGLMDWARNRRYQPPRDQDVDQMVRAEKTYVEKEITKPVNDIKNDSILVSDIHKVYNSLLGKNVNAVRGVNFSVKKGECFGLLGVNGAGKSSTFKMLTAEECTTRGKIYGNGYHLRRGNTEYLQTLGYCPQFFGLDMFLTGRQNLTLVLTLRGLNKKQVREQVKAWIDIVGLEKYANRRVESYSGGCIRRLGTAAALCGGSAATLLDEPSAGVDVAARRRLWAALRKALKQRRSIIITSHSMDEMETLCGRIAIMCSGRVRALGAPAGLRAAHAAGHAVVFKVNLPRGDEVDSAKSQLNLLKGKLIEKFNCNLKDEHKTMLHYHINETMRYSELFAELEELKKEFPHLIEDYSVTETTLEEVFLSLAKEDKAEAEESV